GDRWPGGRRSRAAGDPLGPARHAGKQEPGSAGAPGGLQDPAREDQAVRHFRRTLPAVLTVATRLPVLWWRRHGVRTMVLTPHKLSTTVLLSHLSAALYTLTRDD